MFKQTVGSCLLIGLLVFSACKKTEIDREMQSAQDLHLAETVCNQIIAIALAEAHAEPLVNNRTDSTDSNRLAVDCASKGLFGQVANFPGGTVTLSLDYNGVACADIDNKARQGNLSLVFTNNYWSNRNASFVASPSGYFDETVMVNGNFNFRHVGTDTFEVTLEFGKITGSGFSFAYTFSKQVYWTQGSDTDANLTDDVFVMEGSFEGTNRNGRSFTGAIETPIVWETVCGYSKTGEVTIVPSALAARKVIYRTNCMNTATLNLHGEDSALSLK